MTRTPVPQTSTASVSLITMLALMSALGPFAIDMYLPAFPQMLAELNTTAAAVQLTLTSFMLGMAAGQLVIGPLSDRFGRRKLVLLGALSCMFASIFCAIAPNIEFLIGARFAQGFTGAAGVVLARAIVSDTARGIQAAKLFSILMAVGGIAPVIAPLAGSGVILLAGWRGVYWALALLNVLILLGSFYIVKETLPPHRRSTGGVKGMLLGAGQVLRNRHFVGFTLAFAFSMAAMFGYIAASPFVVQNMMGLDQTVFALIFAINALGITLSSTVAVKLVSRWGPLRMTYLGVCVLLAASCGLLLFVVLGDTPMLPTLIMLFVAMTSLGFIFGNATALATDQVKDHAGSASAIMGALQFLLAALVSPLVGLAGEDSAVPMSIVMVGSALIALLSLLLLTLKPAASDSNKTG